jgi:hypothetical protein
MVFVVTGMRGLDFGTHWDEQQFQIQPARTMISSGILLPRIYNYPSLSRLLCLLPALPAAVATGLNSSKNDRDVQQAILSAMDGPAYLYRVRSVFLFTTALTLVWVYLAVLALRRGWWEALLAACALGFSWQFAYHGRWVANDDILAQFSALLILCLALHLRSGAPGWLRCAAVCVGLAASTKYQGVLLALPVGVAGLMTLTSPSLGSFVKRASALSGLAFAAFVVTTPALVLDPWGFYEGVRTISDEYKQSHYGYTVTPGWAHLGLTLAYLSLDFFSPVRPISVAFAVLSVVGSVAWFRKDRRTALVFLCFPVLYTPFFCWKYAVLIVRNVLLVTPFLAIWFARGVASLAERARVQWARRGAIGGATALLAFNGAWLFIAAESIHGRSPSRSAREALTYVESHPAERFRVSSQVAALAGRPLPANCGSAGTHVVFFARGEGPPDVGWPVNDPFLTEAVFGPKEVDLNWYSTWAGDDHVVIMTLARARAARVSLAMSP